MFWITTAWALSGQEALGTKPMLGVTLLDRWDRVSACGVDQDTLSALHTLADEVIAEEEEWRWAGDADIRAGRRPDAAMQRVVLAALATREEEAIDSLEQAACVRELLDDAWSEDQRRSSPVFQTVSVTYNVYATQYAANTNDEVSVPDYCIKFANLGWGDCSSAYSADPYYVLLDNGGNTYQAWVGDVGPWNIDDNYWNSASDASRPRRLYTDLAQGYNESRAAYYDNYNGGYDQYDRLVGNPAGVDLAPDTAAMIGLGYLENAWINVTWLWEGYTIYPYVSLAMSEVLPADQPTDSREGDGVPDLYPGQTWTASLAVSNSGTETANNVTIGLWAESPFVAMTRWDASTGASGTVGPVNLGSIGAGGTTSITVTMIANEASIGLADHPDLRAWVSHVDNYYEKADFSTAPSVNDHQTWNGGELVAYVQHDVWPVQAAWTWDDGTTEGWWAGNAVTATNGGGTLSLLGTGDDPYAFSPPTTAAASTYPSFTWSGAHYGAGEATLYWVTAEDGTWSDTRSVPLGLAQNEAAEGYVEPGWSGTITRLRLDPGPGVDAAVVLDAAGFGGPGGATVDDGPAGLPGELVDLGDVGCGCGSGEDSAGADATLGDRVPLGDVGACTTASARPWLGLLALLGVLRRRESNAVGTR